MVTVESSTSGLPDNFTMAIVSIKRDVNATVPHGEVHPHATRLIYLVGFPVVMAIGLLGNVCSLAVTTREQFRKRSSYYYLSVLAVADTAVLLFVGAACLILMATNGREMLFPGVYCTLMYFLYHQSTHMASWLLVAITVDRYIHIHYPLLRGTVCTERRAQQVCVIIAMLSVLVNLHYFGTAILVETEGLKYCAARPGAERFVYEIWPTIDALLYAYLPSFSITIMNVLTIRELWRTRMLPSNQYGEVIIKARRTTIMLVNMTSLFVISTVFGNTTMIFLYSLEEVIIKPAVAACDLIIYTNHACNFYIYYTFAKAIRVELKRLIGCAQTVMPFAGPPPRNAGGVVGPRARNAGGVVGSRARNAGGVVGSRARKAGGIVGPRGPKAGGIIMPPVHNAGGNVAVIGVHRCWTGQ